MVLPYDANPRRMTFSGRTRIATKTYRLPVLEDELWVRFEKVHTALTLCANDLTDSLL